MATIGAPMIGAVGAAMGMLRLGERDLSHGLRPGEQQLQNHRGSQLGRTSSRSSSHSSSRRGPSQSGGLRAASRSTKWCSSFSLSSRNQWKKSQCQQQQQWQKSQCQQQQQCKNAQRQQQQKHSLSMTQHMRLLMQHQRQLQKPFGFTLHQQQWKKSKHLQLATPLHKERSQNKAMRKTRSQNGLIRINCCRREFAT